MDVVTRRPAGSFPETNITTMYVIAMDAILAAAQELESRTFLEKCTMAEKHETDSFRPRKKKPTPEFECLECGKKFYTSAKASRAMTSGCPRCNGSDIDVYVPSNHLRNV